MNIRFAPPASPPACARLWFWVLVGLTLAPGVARATDPSYINFGLVTDAPQIDATNFVNYGTFNIITSIPFETSNTRNFTNYGSLIGGEGWFFDTISTDLPDRHLADNFFNANSGLIQGVDEPTFIILGFPNQTGSSPSYNWVQATNIVNQGLLEVGAFGWLRLVGTNVNIARSGVEVTEIAPFGSFNFETNFIPDIGIYDYWWWQTNGFGFDSGSIWDGAVASAPPHFILTQCSAAGFVSFGIAPTLADSYTATNLTLTLSVTNIIGITNQTPPNITNVGPNNVLITNIDFPSNVVRQAVFVSISDPANIGLADDWQDSSIFTNPLKTVEVQLAMFSTNLVHASQEVTSLFFYDTLASETNRGLLANLTTGAGNPTRRPANYTLSRLPLLFGFPNPGNGVPAPNFLFDRQSMSNRFVQGEYSGYSAIVDNLVTEPPDILAGTVTNLPGRIQIEADSLDMTRTRFRGEGLLSAKVRHLVGSSNAIVDCQNLSYNLASTNGTLNLASLTKASVARLNGQIYAWSGLWSNTITELYMNNYALTNITDTNNVVIATNAVQSPITNTYSVNLHVLILDGDFLLDQLPVTVWDLITHSTNVVVNDNMTVVQSFLVDATSLTINGRLALSNLVQQTACGAVLRAQIPDWVSTNSPNLRYFTNNGTVGVPNNAHFGDDMPRRYAAFVNNGNITAQAMHVAGDYFQNSGVLTTLGDLVMVGGAGTLQSGQSVSGGNVNLQCDTLRLKNYRLSSSNGTLWFNVGTALSDAGAGSANQISVVNGFNMLTKPPTGDLLGTSIATIAPDFLEVDHSWAGEDRGTNVSGFLNNVAVGRLVLGPVGRFTPLLYFRGAGAQNGLYVDVLDLTSLGTNYAELFGIDPSLTIYFAAARLSFTPPPSANGIPQEPEEYLDGQFGGHLRWAQNFAGPNSSAPVLVNGNTVMVNAALRNSRIIDSDGDGVPNYFDPTPFGGTNGTAGGLVLTGTMLRANQPPLNSFRISWNASAGKVYQIEFKNDLGQGLWQPFMSYTNTLPTDALVTITDTNVPTGVLQRFYRVGYSP